MAWAQGGRHEKGRQGRQKGRAGLLMGRKPKEPFEMPSGSATPWQLKAAEYWLSVYYAVAALEPNAPTAVVVAATDYAVKQYG